MPKAWLAALLVVFALAPTAAAAPADGSVEATSLALEPAELAAMGIGLRWEQEGAPTLELAAEQLEVRRIGTRYVTDPLGLYQGALSPVTETGTHQRATLTLVASQGDQIVGLKATGAIAGSTGTAGARAVEGVLLATTGTAADAQPCEQNRQECVEMFGAYELATPRMALDVASSTLTLVMRGPTLRVQDADGGRDYASGSTAARLGEAPGREDTWVIVTATGVAGAIAADAPAAWYAVAPTLRTAGASLADATGSLRVGALDYRANDDELRAAGALEILLDPVASATHEQVLAGPVYAETFRAQIHGDVSAVNLAARPVLVGEPAQAAGFAALLVAAGAALAYAWPHVSFAAASLYTRLQKPDILDNEVRNTIYGIIRQHPGISAREVHRQSGQSWGTVVYHLRQLERHHLVVSRALGRTRNYYENHGKYKGMEVQLACLQSDRARALAAAIVRQPGITQEQLAAATGYPQPTTSYYVRKLKQAGLVDEQREGRYARYVPVGDVARFVELASAGPAEPAATPS